MRRHTRSFSFVRGLARGLGLSLAPTLALALLALTAACDTTGGPRAPGPPGALAFQESALTAVVEGGVTHVQAIITATTAAPARGELRVALRHVDGTLLDEETEGFEVDERGTIELTLTGLPPDAATADLAAYILDYSVVAEDGRIDGRRSLFQALHRIELQVLTADRYPAGGHGFVRLFARDPATGEAIADAQVRVELELPDGRTQTVATATTDAFGAVAADLALPEGYEGDARLRVVVADATGEDRAEADVSVLPDARVLLTTDKPLYQPGQTIHLRALALDRGTKAAMADRELLFEVADAAGNKVFKEMKTTNAFGVASADFQLARQVNMGSFELKATIGEVEVKKEVTVDRYSLPKFDVQVDLDKPYYLPGETVHGTLSAQYFFGQPVALGDVTVVASAYDIGFTAFAELTGTTNAEGLYSFTFDMPDYVVGQPLEGGKGLVTVEVTVKDQANQERSVTRSAVVARGDVEVVLVPESGELVPEVENRVYVVVSDPMGEPVEATVTVSAEGGEADIPLDAQGLGVWTVTPATLPLPVSVTVTPTSGAPVTLSSSLAGGGKGQTVLLRTDAALYQVGDTVATQVLLPTTHDRVWIDVIHAGRTVLTDIVPVTDGVGAWSFEADETMTGALQLDAYYLGADSEIVRDERLVYVQPADGLEVRLTSDKNSYLPGAPAVIDVEVTDAEGTPQVAALGVQVVDEAVFALQETQPGLLKVYFELEEALSTPRFQFAWPDLTPRSVVEEDMPGGGVSDDLAVRAEVAFAAQGAGAAYGVDLNTHKQRVSGVRAVLMPLVEEVRDKLVEEAQPLAESGALTWDNAADYIQSLDETDFWGRPYRFEAETDYRWSMTTDGPDETAGTDDDVTVTLDVDQLFWDQWARDGDMAFDGAMAGGAVPEAAEEQNAAPSDDDGGPSGSGGAAIRVRKYFPETLYVNPSVITDESGHAQIDLTMADSITTWRMSALANSASGLLGSTTAGLTVFQDFFVDIDFPATLTRGDTISVPVAVYNYLDVPQTVTLTAQDADWLTFTNGASVTVPLDAGEVDAVSFDVQVDAVGPHALTVVAQGTAMSDAVQRTVLVEPDGKELVDTDSARFHTTAPADEIATESVERTVTIPSETIDGSQKLLVKVYPGFFSQAVEGLDSILQLPGGCLEQTTSSAWPNVLVMDYMRESDTITPEIDMKAAQLVGLGYQRILTFECADGGFNWWEGDNPGNAVLSALVCMMLTDTARVTTVDEAVIPRTQAWLASVQQSDGSWTEERHLHAGNENLGGSSLRATAYIAWGLAHSGYSGAALDRALSFIEPRLDSEEDLYTVALGANALAAAGHTGPALQRALQRLHDARVVEDGGFVHWGAPADTSADTMVGSSGDVADIETTALIGLAMLAASAYPADVEGAVTWLVSMKDPQGNWGYSTQATVLTLKLLLGALSGDAGATDADITVALGGQVIETRHFDDFNKDVLWQVDLSELAVEGDNEITLTYSGLGNLMYQLVASYNVPWTEQPPQQGSVSIDVDYDRTQLEVDDTVTVTVTVTNHDPSQSSMILVDLGRPPGFTLHTEDLAALRAEGVISEWETTDRQILVYLDPLEAEAPLDFSYRLTADVPLTATVPGSSAHPYYDAEDDSETGEFDIEVL